MAWAHLDDAAQAEYARILSTTEHRVEPDKCYLLNRETGAITTLDGVRIRWRFLGERKWRKKVLVPDTEKGQTVESLYEQMDTIVAVLASKEQPA